MFRLNVRNLADDDMTIGSAASVSDRVIGRMKRNLSGRNTHNSSANSVSTTKSSGKSVRNRKQSHRSGNRESVQSAGNRTSFATGKSKNSSNKSFTGATTMDGIDSKDLITKGVSKERRRASSTPIEVGKDEGQSRVINEPVEMSLAELRSMKESELEQAMLKAGVPSEDISRIKDEVTQKGIDLGKAQDMRRGNLVALFVNSGHVRLVQSRSASTSINTGSARNSTEINAAREISSASIGTTDVTLESKSKPRKSKLEKISELQTEKSGLKKENKALKKSMKRLLLQLSETAKEKEAIEKNLEENDREERGSNTGTPSATDTDSKATRRKGDSDLQRGQDVSSNDKNALKEKIKKLQQEHERTEFRLKAEIEILTKEVDSLKRELGIALESVEDAEKRVAEARETASKLKNKLRTMSSKLNDLTEEGIARDKLIGTFTQLLLKKAN